MDTKQKIIKILEPFFGQSTRQMIESYYDNNEPDEIIALARHMLTRYMGEKKAEKLLIEFEGKS